MLSMEQQARSMVLSGEDSDLSATDSDVDSSDEDLGGMWDGLHTPSKQVVKGAVESGAVVMARPLLNSCTAPDERQAAKGAGRITGTAQGCNVTPPGTISEQSYRVLTQHTTTSREVVAGARLGGVGASATVMGAVLGGGDSSGSAKVAAVSGSHLARTNRFD